MATQINPRTPAGSVLVVEDDQQIREVIQWVLEDEGLSVELAGDGEQAIELASRSRPSLVVLDMNLPRLSGEEVARRIHDLYGDTVPIMIVTADGHAPAKAQRAGAFAFLRKPFDLAALITTVRRGLAGGSA